MSHNFREAFRKTDMGTSSLYIRNIPRHIKDQFKGYAARRGTNMTDIIVAFMNKCVAEEKKHIVSYTRRGAGG